MFKLGTSLELTECEIEISICVVQTFICLDLLGIIGYLPGNVLAL